MPRTPFVVCLLLLVWTACSSPLPTIPSGPAPNPMAVDGDAREWEGALRPVPDEAGLSLGVRNDRDALYVAVVAGDTWQARRIAARGLTVWANGTGGRDRVLGVSFPTGMGTDGERGGARPGVYQPGGRPGEAIDPTDLEQRLQDRFALSLDRIEVHRNGASESMAAGGAVGIETAASWTDAGLTVEMRLPLGAGPYALGVGAASTVGLGVELSEVPRRGGLRQALPPGAGFEGARGGRGRGEGAPRPRALELGTVERWVAVELAE